MTISQTTQELLKAYTGRGVSNDPELLLRSKIRLLQNTSKKPKHGLGESGLYCLPDEALTCTSKLRAVLGAVYSTYAERTPDDKPAGREHFLLPADARKDGFVWRLPNKNLLETEARLAGLFNGVEAEFDMARTGMRVARALNADAKARVLKLDLPLFGLAYEFGAQELVNDRGQTYYGPTFEFLGAVGEPEGPAEEEVIRASAICDLVQATIAAAKREAEDREGVILSPRVSGPRPLITSGAAATVIDDDIPF